MKLKYYLRGLGIGIVVTAIIMSFTRQPEKLTDAQIKMRALELGMVEESVLADLQKEDTSSDETVVEESTVQEESANEEVGDTETEEVEMVDEETTEQETVNEETVDVESAVEETTNEAAENESITESNADDITSELPKEEPSDAVIENTPIIEETDEVVESYIVISVAGGNGSEVVSRKLYEAGLVNSAVEYNQFLVRNGYDRKLRVGNHEIPVGATEEEMARILCGMK